MKITTTIQASSTLQISNADKEIAENVLCHACRCFEKTAGYTEEAAELLAREFAETGASAYALKVARKQYAITVTLGANPAQCFYPLAKVRIQFCEPDA